MASNQQAKRICSRCEQEFPLAAEHFSHTPSGWFRSYCRICKNKQTSEWAKENKWSDEKKWTKQNAARANAKGSYSDGDIARIRKMLGDKCAYCGIELRGGGEVDHMIPLDRNGEHNPCNLTIACMPCNRAKGNKTPQEYIAYRRERSLSIRTWPSGTAPWTTLKQK